MFNNECLGGIAYEPTATAIAMAGLFLSFLIEYIGQRLVMRRSKSISPTGEGATTEICDTANQYKSPASSSGHTLANLGHSHGIDLVNSKFSVLVMEAGIIFHSIRK